MGLNLYARFERGVGIAPLIVLCGIETWRVKASHIGCHFPLIVLCGIETREAARAASLAGALNRALWD